jgi:hypothetical protein
MLEAYRYFLDWIEGEFRASGLTGLQMGWVAANVDFTDDYSEVVFSAELPSLARDPDAVRLTRVTHSFHLNVLTGKLRLLFLNTVGDPMCISVTIPKITNDKKWVFAKAVYTGNLPGSVIEESWYINLSDGVYRQLQPHYPIFQSSFASDGRSMFGYYFERSNGLARPLRMVDVFRLTDAMTWELDRQFSQTNLSDTSCGIAPQMNSTKAMTINIDYNLRTCGKPQIVDLANLGQPGVYISEPFPGSIFSEFKSIPGRSMAGMLAFENVYFKGFYLYDIERDSWKLIPITGEHAAAFSWYPTKDGKYILYGFMHEFLVYDIDSGMRSSLR